MIPASIKNEVYPVRVAATRYDLVCCECNCNAGSTGDQRVVCVHIMPVLYMLSMLLCDGLAQHILIELCTRWDNNLERLMKVTGKQYAMRDSITALMSTEGEPEDKIYIARHKHTIGEMLEYFSVGTERKKLVAPKKQIRICLNHKEPRS